MALLSLPNELLIRIVAETMPEGFENFALSCKAVYHATGHSLMDQHNTLRRRYRHFRYSGDGDPSDQDNCASSPQIIARIASDPLIARYITSADFKEDSISEDERNAKALGQLLETSREVRSLFDNSPYLKEAGVDPSAGLRYVIDECAVVEKDYSLTATLLLSMLPNVTSVALFEDWEQWENHTKHRGRRVHIPWDLSILLDVIVRRANGPSNSSAGLSKLTSLLPSTAWGYDNRWKLSTFTPFLSIKSLRRFCAASCRAIDDGYTGAAFHIPKYENFGHGLEIVELVGAVFDGKELLKFLCRLPRLRILRLSYETKWHGFGHDFEAAAAMQAIEDAVGDQLEELSFTILNCYGTIEPRVFSMKRFTKLRKLELDLYVLQMYGHESDLPHLADILPTSVEHLVLVADPIEDHVEFFRLIPGEAAEIKSTLSSLKQVVIRSRLQPESENVSAGSSDQFLKKQVWKAHMRQLEPEVEVEFEEVSDPTLAQFTETFCDRYGVEIR